MKKRVYIIDGEELGRLANFTPVENKDAALKKFKLFEQIDKTTGTKNYPSVPFPKPLRESYFTI